MTITISGTGTELREFWLVWFHHGNRNYTVDDPVDLSKSVFYTMMKDKSEQTYTITFKGWFEGAVGEPHTRRLSFDELKEKFPQWADQIEISFLESLL